MSTLGIVGSRHYSDYAAFCALLDTDPELAAMVPFVGLVISGAAPGVDEMAARWARERGIELAEYAPSRSRPFVRAAHMRNQQIADRLDESRRAGQKAALLALPGPESKGTYDTIRRVERYGIEVIKRDVPE